MAERTLYPPSFVLIAACLPLKRTIARVKDRRRNGGVGRCRAIIDPSRQRSHGLVKSSLALLRACRGRCRFMRCSSFAWPIRRSARALHAWLVG